MNVQTERLKVRTGIQNLFHTGNACEGNWNVVTCDLGVIKDIKSYHDDTLGS